MECPDIRVSYSVKKNESTLYTVDFELTGGTSPYKVIFYQESGKLVSADFSKKDFSGLNAGNYHVTVIDKNNCKITEKVKLQ